MLYINKDGTIRLTRGDTARLTVMINNDFDGKPYEITETDVLKLTVKRSVRDTTTAFQKSVTGSNKFYIVPDDTKDLVFGKYIYDVELTTVGGDVYTVIEPTIFEILKEVTY